MLPRSTDAHPPVEQTLDSLAEQLVAQIPGGQVVIAMSGGVDSAVVAKAASLAECHAIAATGDSASVSQVEWEDACRVASQIGIEHQRLATLEQSDPDYLRNDARRCFYCKSQLYDAIRRNYPTATILNGTNADDLGDHRPGLEAARNSQVCSPLAELGIVKSQVRELARLWELEVADKPASPCLASRIAYGVEVTPERLGMIEQAEAYLRQVGLDEFRVRLHADHLARIEVPAEHIARLAETPLRDQLQQKFKSLGFRFITLDLQGFQSGSLNQVLPITQLARVARP